MLPLKGVTVLDLTRVVAGPFCSMQLGDLGADVIKIEEPARGDESRAFGPPFIGGESAYFLSVNRNKRSCAINLKAPEGRELLLRLASTADVVIENFRPGTMERLQLERERLREANPRLIYCAISGFGSSGPDARRPGYDLIVQGESGLMDITGEADGPPTKVGVSIGDLVAGLYATQGILAALSNRERSGAGCVVEVAMRDALASLLTFNAGIYFATGVTPGRRGNAHPTIAPYETFRASDGWINLGIANDKFWRLFCTTVGADDLASDPRYAQATARVENRETLIPRIAALIVGQPRQYWVQRLGDAGVPYGEIRTVAEVCDAAQRASAGMILQMPHPAAGVVKNFGSPVHFDGQDTRHHVAPPLHGQHTYEILRTRLSISDAEIESLNAQGIVRISEGARAPKAHNGEGRSHG